MTDSSDDKLGKYAEISSGILYILGLLLSFSISIYILTGIRQLLRIQRESGASPQEIENALFEPFLKLAVIFVVIGSPFAIVVLTRGLLDDETKIIECILSGTFLGFAAIFWFYNQSLSGKLIGVLLLPF